MSPKRSPQNRDDLQTPGGFHEALAGRKKIALPDIDLCFVFGFMFGSQPSLLCLRRSEDSCSRNAEHHEFRLPRRQRKRVLQRGGNRAATHHGWDAARDSGADRWKLRLQPDARARRRRYPERRPLKIIMAFDTRPSWFLLGGKNMKSLQDLKGKQLAVSSFGAALDQMTRELLPRFGMEPMRDVVLRAIEPPPNRLAALLSGAIDAAVLTHPETIIARKQGFNELFFFGDHIEFVSAGVVA